MSATVQSSTWTRVRVLSALAALCALSAGACTSSSSKPSQEPSVPAPDASNGAQPPGDPGNAPSDTSSSANDPPPPDALGGQSGEGAIPASDGCLGKAPGPDGRTIVATCWWGLGRESRDYVCCCDSEHCGSGCSAAGEDEADGHCHVPADSCAAAIQSECGGEEDSGVELSISSCEAHSSLGQVACFERPEGGYACDCPNKNESVASEEPDCDAALVRACASDCESTAGRCTFDPEAQINGDGTLALEVYRCECANGLSVIRRAWWSIDPLCEDALHDACEPACENDRGACYGDPSRWSFTCFCDGDSERHTTPRAKPGDTNLGCYGQLTQFCGM